MEEVGGGFLIPDYYGEDSTVLLRVQIMKDGGRYIPNYQIIHSNPFKWIQCSTRKLLAPEVSVRAEKPCNPIRVIRSPQKRNIHVHNVNSSITRKPSARGEKKQKVQGRRFKGISWPGWCEPNPYS